MLNLDEMQFEILPTADAADGGVGFGIDLDVSVDDAGFDPGTDEWVTQDGQNPTRGTTAFGRDILTGPTWAWGLHVNKQDVPGALAALGRIRTAWRGRAIADKPGEVLAIRYRMGDRVRRVYGRPRRFSSPPDNKILNGYVPITADFKCVDAFTYDDEENTVILTASVIGGDTGGGFTFPVTFPVTTLPPTSTDKAGAIVVGGDEAAYPVVRFNGPTTKPWLSVDDGAWRIDLNISLTAGEYAVVDTRAWRLSALKNGVEGIGGKLGRRQWLSDMKLEPGQHNLSFGGQAVSGGANCTVSWRNTHNSI